jgi:hypothetical protein
MCGLLSPISWRIRREKSGTGIDQPRAQFIPPLAFFLPDKDRSFDSNRNGVDRFFMKTNSRPTQDIARAETLCASPIGASLDVAHRAICMDAFARSSRSACNDVHKSGARFFSKGAQQSEIRSVEETRVRRSTRAP